MTDPVTIGLMALSFLVGYAAGRIEAVGDLMKQWQAGYLAGERVGKLVGAAHAEGEIQASALDQPEAWWAETGTAGAGEGCNKPFWRRHEAIAHVRQFGGYVAPLFRRRAPRPGSEKQRRADCTEMGGRSDG